MRSLKFMSRLSSSLTISLLVLTPLAAVAATTGPGTATSNLTTVSTGYVADATGSAQAASNAQFTVAPGSLTLNQVPNITLGSVNVKDIATADTTLAATASAATTGSTYDGNNTGALNISDYRGDHAGWTLTVGMGPFTSGTSTVTSAKLDLNQAIGSVDNATTASPLNLTLSQGTVTNGWISNPETAWLADPNSGEGVNTATTATSSKLTISKQPLISAGTYTATLYWALQNAPVAVTPAH